MNGDEDLSRAAFTAATHVFFSSSSDALGSYSSRETDGLLLDVVGCLARGREVAVMDSSSSFALVLDPFRVCTVE